MKKLLTFTSAFVIAISAYSVVPQFAHAQICADGTNNCATTNGDTTNSAQNTGNTNTGSGSSGTSDGLPGIPGANQPLAPGLQNPTQYSSNPTGQPSAGTANDTGFTALAPIPNLTDNVDTSNGLAGFLNQIYKYLIGLAAILAIIEIIRGGIEISTQDSVAKNSDGKQRIRNAIYGLVLILSPVLIFSIINPAILNLGLNLPNLNTAPVQGGNTGSGGSGGTPQTTVDQNSGCTVTGTSGFLQKAVCPSDAAASDWANQNCTSGTLINAGCGGSNSNGCTQSVRYCRYTTGNLVLVDINASKINYLFAPLAAQPQTVSSFQSFLPGCASSGGNVCAVSSVGPGLWISHDCNNYGGYTTTIPGTSNTSRCYEKTLSCDPPDHTTGDYCRSDLQFSSTPFK